MTATTDTARSCRPERVMSLQFGGALRPARGEDRDAVCHLFADAYLSMASFDWSAWPQLAPPLLALLAHDACGQVWGTIVLQVEPRPATLPACLPGRTYVRGLAVARGRNSRDDVQALLVQALGYLHHQQTTGQLILVTEYTWLHGAAVQAGFQQVDTLRYLHRNLQIRASGQPGGTVRVVRDTDYRELACRDAETFAPLWHMGETELRQQARTGCLLVQQMAPALAGFVLFGPSQISCRQAFITRLAVWPEWQGCRIGSHLLMCAVSRLRRASLDSVGLNVLESNDQARQFYAHHGFRPRGRPQAVFTCPLGNGHP